MIEALAQLLFLAIAAFGIYSLASLGFLLIYLPVRFFNFAAGLPVVGAPYIAFWLNQHGFATTLSGILAVAFAFVCGGALYWCFRPSVVRRFSASALLVATLGLYFAVTGFIGLAFGQQAQVLFDKDTASVSLFQGIRASPAQLLAIALAVVAWLGGAIVWRHTLLGVRLRAVADDARLAAVIGLPVAMLACGAFAAGFALLGTAGLLTAYDASVRPDFAFPVVVIAMVANAVGNDTARLRSIAIAALCVAATETVVAWFAGVEWSRGVALAALIVVLIAAPAGRKERVV